MHNLIDEEIGHALLGDAEEDDIGPVFKFSEMAVIIELPSFYLSVIGCLAHEHQGMCSYGAGERM